MQVSCPRYEIFSKKPYNGVSVCEVLSWMFWVSGKRETGTHKIDISSETPFNISLGSIAFKHKIRESLKWKNLAVRLLTWND
jgi:hypothetical protein